MTIAEASCEPLIAISKRRSDPDKQQRDALTAFTLIHLCICQHISKRTRSPDLLAELNTQFVNVFASVYDAYEGDRIETLHDAWVLAFRLYLKTPQQFVRILLRMAQAHIMVDLRRLLCTLDVSKTDYESVAADIDSCLKSEVWGVGKVDQWWSNLIRIANPLIVMPTIRQARNYVYAQAQKDKLKGCQEGS